VQAEHRALFKESFAAAVAALSPRERTLLRQHLLDGLTVDALAPLYRVHRATAARWLAAVREKVLQATRAELAVRAGLRGEALTGLLSAIRSRLDLSLSRVLGTQR
jgi:RNA polymerase sigma-70 factor (ECF subfamily)